MNRMLLSGLANAIGVFAFYVLIRVVRQLDGVEAAIYFSNFYLLQYLATSIGTLKVEYSKEVRGSSERERSRWLHAAATISTFFVLLAIGIFAWLTGRALSWATALAVVMCVVNSANYVRLLYGPHPQLATALKVGPPVAAMIVYVLVGCDESTAVIAGQVPGMVLTAIGLRGMGSIGGQSNAGLATLVVEQSLGTFLEAANFVSINGTYVLAQIFMSADSAQTYFEYTRLIGAPWGLVLFPLSQHMIAREIGGRATATVRQEARPALMGQLIAWCAAYWLAACIAVALAGHYWTRVTEAAVGHYSLGAFFVASVLTLPRATLGAAFPLVYSSAWASRRMLLLVSGKTLAAGIAFAFVGVTGEMYVWVALCILEAIYVVPVARLLIRPEFA